MNAFEVVRDLTRLRQLVEPWASTSVRWFGADPAAFHEIYGPSVLAHLEQIIRLKQRLDDALTAATKLAIVGAAREPGGTGEAA